MVQNGSLGLTIPLHSMDVHSLNSPNLSTLAGAQSSVGSTSTCGNGTSEGSISRLEGDSSVEVLLRSNSTSAVIIALSSSTVSNSN